MHAANHGQNIKIQSRLQPNGNRYRLEPQIEHLLHVSGGTAIAPVVEWPVFDEVGEDAEVRFKLADRYRDFEAPKMHARLRCSGRLRLASDAGIFVAAPVDLKLRRDEVLRRRPVCGILSSEREHPVALVSVTCAEPAIHYNRATQ